MPAKKQVSKQAIIEASLSAFREGGIENVNTTTLTKKLNCSTQPIYLSFKNMEELKAEVVKEIEKIYQEYLKKEAENGKYPEYKAYGMAYIRFAQEEKQFFRYMFLTPKGYKNDEEFNRISSVAAAATHTEEERAKKFHLEMWIFVHGIATMAATSYQVFDEEFISGMMTDCYNGLTKSLKEN